MITFLNILAEQGRLSTHSEVMLELPNASGLNDLYIFITLLHMGELRDTMSSKTIRKILKNWKTKMLITFLVVPKSRSWRPITITNFVMLLIRKGLGSYSGKDAYNSVDTYWRKCGQVLCFENYDFELVFKKRIWSKPIPLLFAVHVEIAKDQKKCFSPLIRVTTHSEYFTL